MVNSLAIHTATLFLVVALCTANLQIIQQLPPQNKHIEPSETRNISLTPNQPFRHKQLNTNSIDWQSSNAQQYCHAQPSSLQIQTIFQMQENQEIILRTQYLYSNKYNKIYAINQKKLAVYKYSPDKQTLQRLSEWTFETNCTKSAIIDKTGQYLYVFSCQGIVMIQVRTGLSNVQYVAKFQIVFYGSRVTSLGDMFIWSSTYSGFKVYAKENDYNLTLKQQVSTFRDQRLFISDIAYDQYTSLLYLLSLKQKIYVFERGSEVSQRPVIQLDIIEFPETDGNFILRVHKHNIYVCSNFRYESSISELQYYRGQVDLIRYFKGYDLVMDMDIVDEHLMVIQSSKIDLYPINIDPREINLLMNGVTNDHLKDLIGFKRLAGNVYIAITYNKITLVKLIITKPEMRCIFDVEGIFQVNIKVPCQDVLTKKDLYYDSCEKTQILNFSVEERSSRIHIFWFVLLAISVFLVIIMGLMFWRKGKMRSIDILVNQIRKIKLKHQQRVEFVEDSQPPVKYPDWKNYVENDAEGDKQYNQQHSLQKEEEDFYNSKSSKRQNQVIIEQNEQPNLSIKSGKAQVEQNIEIDGKGDINT